MNQLWNFSKVLKLIEEDNIDALLECKGVIAYCGNYIVGDKQGWTHILTKLNSKLVCDYDSLASNGNGWNTKFIFNGTEYIGYAWAVRLSTIKYLKSQFVMKEVELV